MVHRALHYVPVRRREDIGSLHTKWKHWQKPDQISNHTCLATSNWGPIGRKEDLLTAGLIPCSFCLGRVSHSENEGAHCWTSLCCEPVLAVSRNVSPPGSLCQPQLFFTKTWKPRRKGRECFRVGSVPGYTKLMGTQCSHDCSHRPIHRSPPPPQAVVLESDVVIFLCDSDLVTGR